MNNFNWVDLITIVIALWGAGLSTYLMFRKRPRLVVTFRQSYFINSFDERSEPCIEVKIVKKGSGSFFIDGWGFSFNDKSKTQITKPYPRTDLPLELREGQSHIFGYSCREVEEHGIDPGKVKFIYVNDATGKSWKKRIKEKELIKYLSVDRNGWKINTDIAFAVVSHR